MQNGGSEAHRRESLAQPTRAPAPHSPSGRHSPDSRTSAAWHPNPSHRIGRSGGDGGGGRNDGDGDGAAHRAPTAAGRRRGAPRRLQQRRRAAAQAQNHPREDLLPVQCRQLQRSPPTYVFYSSSLKFRLQLSFLGFLSCTNRPTYTCA